MPRAIKFDSIGDASVLKLVEAPLREAGPGEVRFKAEALGLMFADVLWRSGQYPQKPHLPDAGIGYEAAGVVDAVGQGVTGYKVGDRVTSMTNFSLVDYAAHRESVVLPAQCVAPVPAGLSAEEAAGFWNAFVTAYLGIAEAGRLEPGQVVLATAATSSVGAAAIQVIHRLGGTVIATTRSRDKTQQLKDQGADHVVVTGEEDLVTRVQEITGGRGVDLVFDAVGGSAFESYGHLTRPHGHLMSYGALSLKMPVMPMLEVMLKRLKVSAYTIFEHTGNEHFNSDAQPAAVDRARRFILEGLELKRLKPVITKVFHGFDNYLEAARYVEQGRNSGKVVLRL